MTTKDGPEIQRQGRDFGEVPAQRRSRCRRRISLAADPGKLQVWPAESFCGKKGSSRREEETKRVAYQALQQGGWPALKGKRHLLSLSILLILFLYPHDSPAASFFPEDGLTARAAFLMDGSTGQVLYQREPDLPLPPASTTKIVAAIIALESGSLSDIVPVSRTATRVPSSKIGLRPGQAMSIRDLLYGLLLSSANDASLVLAEGIGGSVAHFAEMMTRKARAIGAKNSQFVNPHGLTAPGHYSTARDMALLFNYAIKHPEFRKIVQTKTSSVRLISTGKSKRPLVRQINLRSHNRLLWGFDGAIGGKTGYTFAAQKTFVGGASRNGTTLIVSILGSRNLWGDTKKLLEYGFEQHQTGAVAVSVSSPSPSNGHLPLLQEKPSSPLFSWEEEQRVQSSNGYFLQVASFHERERAESLQKRIIDDGYRAYVEVAPLDTGETAYRVRVGPYPQLAYAQEVAREIENESGFRAIIVSVPLPATVDKLR